VLIDPRLPDRSATLFNRRAVGLTLAWRERRDTALGAGALIALLAAQKEQEQLAGVIADKGIAFSRVVLLTTVRQGNPASGF
jgi:hypothetical protein